MAIEKPREIALRVVCRAFESEEVLDRILGDRLKNPRLGARDRGLIQELVFGVIRGRRLLDHLVGEVASRRPEGMLQAAVQLGVYQLLFLTRVPDYAVVDEMVSIVKRRIGASQGRFMNAVLRQVIRRREELLGSIEVLKRHRPEVAYSCPDWLYRRWKSRLSAEELRSLLEWNVQIPDVFARLNPLATTEEALRHSFDEEGIRAVPVPVSWAPSATVFRIENPSGVAQRRSFKAGAFYIQDPSTLLSVELLDPKAGERVLDFCSAPGGKTGYIAGKMGNSGEIVACDVVAARLELVSENCRRLGIGMVNPVLLEGAGLPPAFAEAFDRVLVDAPCSNTGVMRRRADLRWRLRRSEILELSKLQSDLLHRAAGAVKPGGQLVYSTCSLEPEENGEVVSRFLAEFGEFSMISDRQLSPYTDACDGAYVALMIRE